MGDVALTAGTAAPSFSPSGQIWGIAKQEILFLCWALMEIALLTPLALFVMPWTRFWPAGQIALWLLLLMLLPFNLVRFLSGLQVQKKHQWRIMLMFLLLTLFITWRVMLFNPSSFLDLGWLGDLYRNFGASGSLLWTRMLIFFLLIVFTWWRGLGLVNFRADIYKVGSRLRGGILLFVPLALLPDLRTSAWGSMPFVLLFVLSGLTSIAFIRAEQVERERSGFAASLNPRWVGTIFLTSLLVVLLAALFAAVVSGEMLGLIAAWLSPVRMAVLIGTAVALATLFFLATPLFFLFDLLLIWLTQFFSSIFINFSERLGINLPSDFGAFNAFLPSPEEAAEVTGLEMPYYVTRILALLVMVGVILLVSMALTRRFRRVDAAPRMGGPIRDIGGEVMPKPTIGRRILDRLGLLRQWRTAASIRSIYRQMCQAAAGAGYARSITETPYEYLEALAKVWPDGRSESMLITDAYIRIRYGEIPESKDELEAIKQAWYELEQSTPAT
jgi:hypothetical protein